MSSCFQFRLIMGKVFILVALLVQGIYAGQELELDDIGLIKTNNVKKMLDASDLSLENREVEIRPVYEHSTEENSQENVYEQESEKNIVPKRDEDAVADNSVAPKSVEVDSFVNSTEEKSQDLFSELNSVTYVEPQKDEASNTSSAHNINNASDILKSVEVESSMNTLLSVTTSLKPEDQIAEIQAASKRLAQYIEKEFASLVSMITSNKRSKRDVSELTGNRFLMRLLKHIKANNEHQNLAIEEMMSGQEIADMYGIDLTPDFESNEVSFYPSDPNSAASEQTEDISSPHLIEEKVSNSTTATDETSTKQSTIQNVFTQQYYDTAPLMSQSPGARNIPEGEYYYYEVETPIESNTEKSTISHTVGHEPTQVQGNIERESSQNIGGTYKGYTVENPAMTFVPPGTSESVNPFYYPESSTPVTAYGSAKQFSTLTQEPVTFSMDTQEEEDDNITTEEIEEKVVSEATTEQGDGLKVTHINKSSYRISQTYAMPHYHYRINALPHQYQYYFSLA